MYYLLQCHVDSWLSRKNKGHTIFLWFHVRFVYLTRACVDVVTGAEGLSRMSAGRHLFASESKSFTELFGF